jgi:excisionase family DNA binding protein
MDSYRLIELLKEIKSLLTKKQKPDKWLDIAAAADYCSVSRSTLRRHISQGSLSASNNTGKTLFKLSNLEQWLNG